MCSIWSDAAHCIFKHSNDGFTFQIRVSDQRNLWWGTMFKLTRVTFPALRWSHCLPGSSCTTPSRWEATTSATTSTRRSQTTRTPPRTTRGPSRITSAAACRSDLRRFKWLLKTSRHGSDLWPGRRDYRERRDKRGQCCTPRLRTTRDSGCFPPWGSVCASSFSTGSIFVSPSLCLHTYYAKKTDSSGDWTGGGF